MGGKDIQLFKHPHEHICIQRGHSSPHRGPFFKPRQCAILVYKDVTSRVNSVKSLLHVSVFRCLIRSLESFR